MLATALCTLRRTNCGCLGPLMTPSQIAARAFAGNPKQKGKLNKKQQAKADAKAASQYLDVFARAVDSHGTPTSLSEEEQAANWEIVKEYQRGLSRRHNKQRRELRRLLDLKWAAVEKLPTERDREEALKMPTRPFPPVRARFPLLQTPPIPNFAELKSRGKILFDD